MKKLLLVIAAIFAVSTVCAQDKIVLRNDDADEIAAKVEEIGETQIKYRKASNPNGPLYSINRKDVFFIRYMNGEKEIITPYDEPAEEPATVPEQPATPTAPTAPAAASAVEDSYLPPPSNVNYETTTLSNGMEVQYETAAQEKEKAKPFEKGSIKFGLEILFLIPDRKLADKEFAYGLNSEFFVNYYVLNRVFIGAGFGINHSSSSIKDIPGGMDQESSFTSLRVPLSVGYTLPISKENVALEFATGPGLHLTIAGKTKSGDQEIKLKDMDVKKFHAVWDIGATIYFWGFGASVGYSAALEESTNGFIYVGFRGRF